MTDIIEIRRTNLIRLIGSRTKASVAEKWGTSASMLSQITSKNPKRNLGNELARRIEEREDLPRGYLDRSHTYDQVQSAQQLTGHSVQESSPREADYALIPQLSAKGQNGAAGYLNDHVEVTGGLAFKRTWLAKMRVKHEKLSIIYAEGDSMEPYIIAGDVVLIDHGCIDPISGQVYALRRPDGGVSIKRLIQQMSGEWILSSDNPNKALYRDEPVSADSVSQVPIIGRVVWRGGAMQ